MKAQIQVLKKKHPLINPHLYVNILSWAFMLFLTILGHSAKAIDPVTITVTLSPPYSPFLEEYARVVPNRLMVNIRPNAVNLNNHPARLIVFFESINGHTVLKSNPHKLSPMYLTGNVPEMLTSSDLAQYFNRYNFLGNAANSLMSTGRIPDGNYRMGFYLIDGYRSDVRISNIAYTPYGWYLLNQPPQLNLPRKNAKEKVHDIQNVIFEWFPRHLGGMNTSFPVEYELEIYPIRQETTGLEVYVNGRNPEYTYKTNQTRAVLNSSKYLMEPDIKYAWRVRAYYLGHADDLRLFENNGYSSVQSFVYGTLCPAPENVSEVSIGLENAVFEWDVHPKHIGYDFEYGHQSNNKWSVKGTYSTKVAINDMLRAGNSYRYRVKAKCGTIWSEYTPVKIFRTNTKAYSNFTCGEPDDKTEISNKNPKVALQKGEIIYSGLYPIKVTKIEGGNGTFTGEGKLAVPMLNNIKINVIFKDIKVNELNQVYQGEIESVFNPDSPFYVDDVTDYLLEGYQVGNIITGEEQAAVVVGSSLDGVTKLTIKQEGDKLTISGSGISETIDSESIKGGTTIEDSEGNLYAVDKSGNVAKVGTSGSAISKSDSTGSGGSGGSGSSVASPSQSKKSESATVTFENSASATWAFDGYNSRYDGASKFTGEYEDLDGYKVPWKLVPEGKSGKVSATLSGDADPTKIIFKTGSGTEYDATYSGGKFELTIVGSKHGDGQEIYALHQIDDSTTERLGKLKVASYKMITRKLALVPIENASIDASNIEKQLNDIYQKYGISWKVRSEPKFTDMSWAGDDGKLDAGKSDFFSAYTSEMLALNAAFTADRKINADEVYLFVFDTEAANAGSMPLLGDMPIGYQFGYLFMPTGSDITIKTIAHELGHGLFQLKHTFSSSIGIDKGSTDNLMDYSTGTELVKRQWDVIFDPQILVAKFLQSEDEGQYIEYVKVSLTEDSPKTLLPGKSYMKIEYEVDRQEIPQSKELDVIFSVKDKTKKLLYKGEGILKADQNNGNFEWNGIRNDDDKPGLKVKQDQLPFELSIGIFNTDLQGKLELLGLKKENSTIEAVSETLYPWVDRDPQAIIDPRAKVYLKDGQYQFDLLEKDLRDFVNNKFSKLYNTGAEETQLLLDTRYYGWLYRYTTYMVNEGVGEIPDISSNAKNNIKTEFSKYLNNLSGQYSLTSNVYFKVREVRTKAEKEELFAKLRGLSEFYKYQRLVEDEGWNMVILEFVSGSLSGIVSTAALMAPEPTMTSKIMAYAGYYWMFESYSSALRRSEALSKGFFDPDKDYRIVGGIVQDQFGDKAVIFYDLAEMAINGLGVKIAFQSALKGTIKGQYLNAYIESIGGSASTAIEAKDAIEKLIKYYEEND